MIVEVADFQVAPDQHQAFRAAIAHGVRTVLSQAQGYLGHQILAGHESPGRFLLVVQWSTLEDHTVGFRGSPAFAVWRSIVGPYFAQPPQVEHFHLADQG